MEFLEHRIVPFVIGKTGFFALFPHVTTWSDYRCKTIIFPHIGGEIYAYWSPFAVDRLPY